MSLFKVIKVQRMVNLQQTKYWRAQRKKKKKKIKKTKTKNNKKKNEQKKTRKNIRIQTYADEHM